MSHEYKEFETIAEYEAAYGERWPKSAEDWISGNLADSTVGRIYPSTIGVVVDEWAPEGWVAFLPGGSDGPDDQVGRVVVMKGRGSLPARVCRPHQFTGSACSGDAV